MKRFIFFLIGFILGGCAVGPNYKTPENHLNPDWVSSNQELFLTDQSPETSWWHSFKDPLLNDYIGEAFLYNNEILYAESRIQQARAARQVKASAFYPHLEANLNGTKTYFSKNGPLFYEDISNPSSIGTQTQFPFKLEIPRIQALFNAFFDASWEIDLFGKHRRGVESAQAIVESNLAQRDGIRLFIAAEIARNYIELRSLQEKERLVQQNLQLLESKKQIICKQLEKGYVSQLNLEEIEASLADESSLIPPINAEIRMRIYALSVLIGRAPETLLNELSLYLPLPQLPSKVAIGIRSELLRRRPDIRQSERELAAATANIGVGMASFFPSITILGNGGVQALQLRELFNSASKAGAIGGILSLPVFQGGRLTGNLKSLQAIAIGATYSYQQTVLKAFEETESALIAYQEGIKGIDYHLKSSEKKEILYELSQQRYKKGLIPFIEVIDSQRNLITERETLLENRTQTLITLITLYKRLGGNWD